MSRDATGRSNSFAGTGPTIKPVSLDDIFHPAWGRCSKDVAGEAHFLALDIPNSILFNFMPEKSNMFLRV